jgi:hypothetical protein
MTRPKLSLQELQAELAVAIKALNAIANGAEPTQRAIRHAGTFLNKAYDFAKAKKFGPDHPLRRQIAELEELTVSSGEVAIPWHEAWKRWENSHQKDLKSDDNPS